jgi:hypothetical protein
MRAASLAASVLPVGSEESVDMGKASKAGMS